MIESRTTRRFWEAFDALPARIRRDAIRAYRKFREDPYHPGLRFKKLEGQDDIYSVRVTLGYRALGVMTGSRIVWYWIGTHADYDRNV